MTHDRLSKCIRIYIYNRYTSVRPKHIFVSPVKQNYTSHNIQSIIPNFTKVKHSTHIHKTLEVLSALAQLPLLLFSDKTDKYDIAYCMKYINVCRCI